MYFNNDKYACPHTLIDTETEGKERNEKRRRIDTRKKNEKRK